MDRMDRMVPWALLAAAAVLLTAAYAMQRRDVHTHPEWSHDAP